MQYNDKFYACIKMPFCSLCSQKVCESNAWYESLMVRWLHATKHIQIHIGFYCEHAIFYLLPSTKTLYLNTPAQCNPYLILIMKIRILTQQAFVNKPLFIIYRLHSYILIPIVINTQTTQWNHVSWCGHQIGYDASTIERIDMDETGKRPQYS